PLFSKGRNLSPRRSRELRRRIQSGKDRKRATSGAPVKPIDSVLKILVQQGGTELRLASDERPQMFKDGAELPLTIPPMSAPQIRAMLDDLWSSQEGPLRNHGQAATSYTHPELGHFVLQLVQSNESALKVSFRRAEKPTAGRTMESGAATGGVGGGVAGDRK